MQEKTYDELVREQIEQFRDMPDIHALPEIYHTWSGRFLAPALRDVFDVATVADFFAQAFIRGAKGVPEPTFLSLGCGDGAVEISVAQRLLELGLTHFSFDCLDLSDLLIDRFHAALPPELAGRLRPQVRDLNRNAIDRPYNAVMANHSLHHMVDLEGIFAGIYANLAPGGVFAANDMIGRNGHMRWPEAKLFIDFFWPFLSEAQRRNWLLSRTEASFINHDCSTEGFEGIRAQDILPVILAEGFHPVRFYGGGGFIDPFLDRCFGHNLDPKNPNDVFLVRRIGQLNELLLDNGVITPTIMLAWFTKEPGEERCYRGRTAEQSVRPTDHDPAWLAAALEDCELPDFVFQRRVASDIEAQARQAVEISALKAELAGLRASTSWRITAPLRRLVTSARRLRQPSK